jgi:hypothetical protein
LQNLIHHAEVRVALSAKSGTTNLETGHKQRKDRNHG